MCQRDKHDWCLFIRGISNCDCPSCRARMNQSHNPITFAELLNE